jgi:ATP-binding cassette subfamily B protein
MKRIIRYLKKYWWIYLLGFGSMSVGIFLDMFNPIIAGRIIDEVIVKGDKNLFGTLALLLIGITVGRAIAGYAKEMLFDFVGVNIMMELRQNIFDHIQSLSYNFFESKNTGELMARIKEDAERVWEGSSFGIMLAIESFVTLCIASYLMLLISPKLSIITFITLPILGWLALALERKIGKTYEDISEQNAVLNTTAQENIAGVRLVKAFAREKHEIKKFLEKNDGYYKLNYKQAKIWGLFYPRIELMTNILPILVITIGGAFVVGEEMTIGTLIKFSGYMYMVIWPMRILGWITNVMAEAFASARKIDTVFKCETEIKNKEDGIVKDELIGRIEFKNVSLKLKETEILKDLNFTVEPNKTLAIMGTTGSGKSSIINVLTRFYDHSSGTIKIDGVELADYDLHNLRSHISVVMQDVFLFSDTIEENILFGVKETTDHDAMIEKSMSAQAHGFIDRMDESYQTVIGEKGIGLSGGQKQRISIARAFAKNANILVFDDSTSSLDMETEYQIQQEIEKLENVTKIIIAHRISAVKKADEIMIIDKGEIVERGTHKELIALEGRYYQTYCEQYEGFMAG